MTTKQDLYFIESQQKRWDKIRIANLFDALESMGYYNQCLDLDIRPFSYTSHLAGVAVTIRGARDPIDYDGMEKGKRTDKNIFSGSPDIRDFIFPGAVLVIDGAGEKVTGKMGEMTSWSFKQAGAKGIVVDGYIRDRLGLEVIKDYCVCARGTSPIESNCRWHAEAINQPIAMPGSLTTQIPVFPGDWIIGGDDGVIVVPISIADEALKRAEEIEEKENGMREDLASGMPFDEAYQKWGRS